MSRPAPVVLVTDFGLDDTYAAALVGACWGVDPAVPVVAGTHAVPPGDVLAGAYHLHAVSLAFAPGTVLCGVVDPGVGTDRGAVAAEVGDQRFVGPDNGLLTLLWRRAAPGRRRCVALSTPPGASATFHGRDLFAPVAARLAAGSQLDDVGVGEVDPVLLAAAAPRRDPGGDVWGRVAVVDHFGNAITTVHHGDLEGAVPVAAEWRGGGTERVVRTYAEIDQGVALLLGSAGHWEVAARGAPALSAGGPAIGAGVRLRLGAPA